MPTPLARLLRRHRAEFSPILPVDLHAPDVARLNFTATNPLLAGADLRDTAAFTALIARLLADQQADIGIGGYLENRVIYRRSPDLFADPVAPARTLHLGVDVWLRAGTPVLAPLPAVVHSLADNAGFGDYGPHRHSAARAGKHPSSTPSTATSPAAKPRCCAPA